MRVTSHVKDSSLFFLPLFDFFSNIPPRCPKTRRISDDTDILTLYCVYCTFFSGCDVEVWKTECLATEDHPGELFNYSRTWRVQGTFRYKTVVSENLFSFNFSIFFFLNVRYSVPVLNQPQWLTTCVWALTVKSDRLPVNSLVNPADPFVTSDNSFLLHNVWVCVCARTPYIYCMCRCTTDT